jgi:glycosyltransferase involved in cell wall biosynthesis
MEKTNISVILPVHELNDETKKYLDNAIESVIAQTVRPDELVIVAPKGSDVVTYLKTLEYGDYKESVVIAENDGLTDFASQINYGVSVAKTEWFSVLELDDEYASVWFKNAVKYREAHQNVDLFLPIIVDVDAAGQFIGFSNEAVWAQSFSDELGILDLNALLAYQNFNIDGMVIKKEVFESLGGIKAGIKLMFNYEFLLRMTFKDVRVMIIPRFGYKHLNLREGSLFSSYKEQIDPVEARWWLAQAKKEYYHTKDRGITYDTLSA